MKYTLKEKLEIFIVGLLIGRQFDKLGKSEQDLIVRLKNRLTDSKKEAILGEIAKMDARVYRDAFLMGESVLPKQIIYSLNTKNAKIEARYSYGDFIARISSNAKKSELPNNYSSVVAHDAAFAWQLYGALETLYRKQQNAR